MKKIPFWVVCAIILASFSISNTANARWQTYEDAVTEIDFYNLDISINKDGTSEEILELQEKILKEQGRSIATNFRLNYNASTSKISIIEAKTITPDGKVHVVTKEMIEDKQIASIGYGFDDQNQILISFPNIEIGSKIYLKMKKEHFEVPVKNFYASVIDFGETGYQKEATININSQIPLYLVANDPKQTLHINKNKEEGFGKVTIKLVKPAFNLTTNEPQEGVINPEKLTWISISSDTKWDSIANQFSGSYDEIASRTLPELFQEIAKKAEAQKTIEDKLDFITSELNQKIQYMGDWRSIKGKFIPRDLAKIAETKVGDCKDFTISTIAILRKLGINAYPALVFRGEGVILADELPRISNFNHVMVKAQTSDQKMHWIDPTNLVSMAGSIFPDIAGKKTLVLKKDSYSYETIPEIDSNHAKTIITETVEIDSNQAVNRKGKISLEKESAYRFTGAELFLSPQQIEELFFRAISPTTVETHNKKHFSHSDLKSRIVKNIELNYEYLKEDDLFKTNNGYGLLRTYDFLTAISNSGSDEVTDLYIGSGFSKETNLLIKNVNAAEIEKLNFSIDTQWISFTRKLSYDGKDNVKITEIISCKKSFISNKELQSQEYKKLKTAIKKDINNVALVLKPLN